MKIRKSLVITIVVILSIIMSIGLFGVTASAAEITASGTCGDNLTWTLDSEGLLTISGSGEMKSHPLYVLRPWHDYCSSIKKVVIEDGVSSIGSYAFKGCSALTSINIPNSVTSIGEHAFDDCRELTSITIPDSVTKIGSSAFTFCSKLESITIPFVGLSADATGWSSHFGAIFGYVISTSSDYHFEDDGYYYKFTIPLSLKNVTIGNAASSIGDYAFNKCTGLESISISDSVTSIGNYAFYGYTGLTSIPDSVTSIGDYAFYGYTGLTSIPDSVTSVGDYAFYECTGLTSISDNITSIGGYAFYGCTGLKSITVPATHISDHAFDGCTGLESITIPNGVTSIGDWTFYLCYSLANIVIPDSVTSIGESAFYACTSLTSVKLPNGITTISDLSFAFCKSLRSITIPKNVTEIGAYAFSSCSNLVEVYNLSGINITKGSATNGGVGYHALCIHTDASSKSHLHTDANGFVFYEDYDNRYLLGYKGTDSILTLPEYCNGKSYQIYKNAFEYNTNLTSVILGKGVNAIGNSAFLGCSNLNNITIQTDVTDIGDRAFYDCVNLEKVYYTGTTSDKYWIFISYDNDCLINATWHTYSCIGTTEHSYTAVVTPPTCTSAGYTTHTCICDKYYDDTFVNALGHSFGEWYTEISATCASEGTERRDCSDCYYYETRIIRKTSHDYSVTKTTTPNCTEPGRDIYTCFDCGHSYSTVYTPALGHNVSSWTVVSSATCTQDGNRWRECTRACGYREEETLPANGHNYYDICDSTCDVCGAERVAPHDYVWIIDRESNCGIWGIMHQECTLCHNVISENTGIPTKGNHEFDRSDDMVCNICEREFVWLYFDTNGGSYVAPIKARLKDFTQLPSSTSKSGYNFAGWSTEKNGYAMYPVGYSYYATEANVTLYAQWNKHCDACSGTGQGVCGKCLGGKTETYNTSCGACYGNASRCSRCNAWLGIRRPSGDLPPYGSAYCRNCGPISSWQYCYTCDGSGLALAYRPCDPCDGTGKGICSSCKGRGEVTRTNVSAPEKPVVESISGSTVTLKAIENGEYSIDGTSWRESPIFEGLEFDKEYSFYQRYAKTDTTYASDSSEVLKVTICSHAETEWIVDINPSCSKEGSKHQECTICKDILSTEIIEKLPHSYSSIVTDPTCIDQGYTTYTCVCGDEYVDNYVDALGHSLGDWYEVTAPTCTVDGLERHDCSRCDHYETNVLDKLGHSYNSVVTAPTCTEKGYTTHTCHCEDSYIDSYVDALGHNCGEWYVVTAPTCTVDGLERRDCTRCEYYETNTLGATGHTHIPEITLPTCTEKGSKTYICSCGDSYIDSYITALGHSYGAWYEVVSSTCTTNGSARRDCSRCAHFETKTVDPLGHNVVHHEAKAPTCTENGWDAYDTCARCDYSTKVELSATGHSASDWIIDTEATYENNGSKHTECTVCHIVLEESIIPMLTHSYVSVVTNPTCTEEGFTTHTCSECGNSYVDDYVSALGHNYGEWETTVTPTCTENGTSRRDCLRCHHYETKSIAATGHKFGDWHTYATPSCVANGEERKDCENCDHFESKSIDATGHDYISTVTSPTCSERGYTTYTCDCGDTYIDAYVNALGHSYGDWYEVTVPTCTTDGIERHDCSRCEHYETKSIATTGHAYTSEVTEPTCTERGYTTHTCHCNDSYVDSYVDARGHNYGEWYEVTAPTCIANGLERHDCSRCEHYETNTLTANGHTTIVDEAVESTCTSTGLTEGSHCSKCNEVFTVQIETPKKAHTYDDKYDAICNVCGFERDAECAHLNTEILPKVDTTCTTAGLTEGKKCLDCDELLIEQTVINATGHTYETVITAPTCTEKGYTTHTCDCGDYYVDSYVDALDHDWNNGVITVEPTVSSKGEMLYTCEICGEERKEDIPKLDQAPDEVGDLDGEEGISSNDAIYLLMHTFFPEEYPVSQESDFDNNGTVDSNDAIYLLMHTFFPEEYPLVEPVSISVEVPTRRKDEEDEI